ncbi:MAG: hypothetical protein ABIT83_08375 [Massilia sp.]
MDDASERAAQRHGVGLLSPDNSNLGVLMRRLDVDMADLAQDTRQLRQAILTNTAAIESLANKLHDMDARKRDRFNTIRLVELRIVYMVIVALVMSAVMAKGFGWL